jgi:hypothetical protein
LWFHHPNFYPNARRSATLVAALPRYGSAVCPARLRFQPFESAFIGVNQRLGHRHPMKKTRLAYIRANCYIPTVSVTFEGVVENGRIRLSGDICLPEKAKVYVILPNGDTSSAYIASPRLAHPDEAIAFKKEVIQGITE